MRKAVICLAAGLAVLTVSALGTFGSKPIENPDFAGPKVGLVKTDQNGDRVWQGAQPAIINKILAGFTPLQERYPNNIIGSALTSDRQVLEVYVRNVAGPGMEQLSALASKYPQRIRVKTTTVTEADAQRVSDYISEHKLWKNPVLGVGLSVETDSVTVDVDPTYLAKGEAMPLDSATLGVKLTFKSGAVITPLR